MNEIRGIPVVQAGGASGTAGRAILREIEALLTALVERGESGSIDLRALPVGPEDRALLEQWLGEGEVYAEVESVGGTRVRESAVPGVWWVIHDSTEGQPMAEFIEVTYCPEILMTPADDAREGLQGLRARLFQSEIKGGTASG